MLPYQSISHSSVTLFLVAIKLNVTVGKNNVVANLKMKNDATFVENLSDFKIEILPNPVNDNFLIKSFDPILKILLLDLRGQVIKTTLVNESGTYNMNVSEVSSGSYIIQIFTDKNMISKSIMIIH